MDFPDFPDLPDLPDFPEGFDVDDVNDPILAAYLSDQFALVNSIETYAHVADSRAERSSSYSSYSDRPDYNPGMNNPAEAVPPSLLPHVHLVSTYNYPLASSIPVETVVEYLIQAPRITRDLAPVGWKFLDPPRDGTVMLVWQPPQLGTSFASDGLVWADAEYAFDTDARGYKLVMFKHKAGYIPHLETHVAHSRRRYRLTGVASTNPNPLPFDPSLWLVHYCAADATDKIPANSVAISRQASHFFAQRALFQQHGQLSRNEFMLHDRARWPTVNLPPNVNLASSVNVPTANIIHPSQQAKVFPSNAVAHPGQSQQPQFTQQPQGRIGQANDDTPLNIRQRSRKLRARLDARAAAKAAAANAVPAPASTDDEDGDSLDYLTPRDISSNRYKQHHEWMEEIYNSPYETSKIIPGEIGLGRKGEIEALTKEFFKAYLNPGLEPTSDSSPSEAGKIGPEKMVAIRKAFKAYMAEQDAEIEEMKREHARNMAAMERSRRLGALERELRIAPMHADATIPNSDPPRRTVGEIIEEAEELLAMRLEETSDEVTCLENGGLDETWAATHGFGSGNSSTKPEGQLSQSAKAVSQPNSSSAPQASQQEPASMHVGENQTTVGEALVSTEPLAVEDVVMGGVSNTSERKHSDGGEWVMVGNENTSNSPINQDAGGIDSFVNIPANDEGEASGEPLNTVGGSFEGFMPNTAGPTSEGFTGNDFNEAIDFGNLDTAGEALEGYGDLGLDESAFGDAYNGPQANASDQHHIDAP